MLMRTRRIVDSAKALPVLVEQMDVCLDECCKMFEELLNVGAVPDDQAVKMRKLLKSMDAL